MINDAPHDNHCRAIEAIYPDGTTEIFKTLKACAEKIGTSTTNLTRIIRKDKDFKGITFRDAVNKE